MGRNSYSLKLSTHLYIGKSATARAIKSLETKGYVIKNKDENDKRINRIFLTDKAKNLQEDIKQHIFYWSEFLLKDIDEESMEFFYKILENMVDKVEKTNLKCVVEDSLWNK